MIHNNNKSEYIKAANHGLSLFANHTWQQDSIRMAAQTSQIWLKKLATSEELPTVRTEWLTLIMVKWA